MNFLYSRWLKLPIATRAKIAAQFGIGKTRPTHVADNVVVDDGYTIQSIEQALTVQALNAYTGADTDDVEVLWSSMLDKVEGRVTISPVVEAPPLEELPKEPEPVAPVEVKKTVKVKKPVTKKKNAKA